LITGASAGIGAALAKVFAARGHATVLVARREAQLAEVADAIRAAGHVRPIVIALDLGKAGATDMLAAELERLGIEPEIVVNNAGFGLLGPAAKLDRCEQLAMVDLNARVLTDLSLRWIDALERHRGGILNVASIASYIPGPAMTVYHATKAYVLAFSEGLRHELAPRGIRVTALCPGPVATEFQARAGFHGTHYPKGFDRSAESVAEQGYRGLKANKRAVVPGLHNKIVPLLPRFMPRGMLAGQVFRRLKNWDGD
jgi:short-subunit dehydrogenase